ncbi:MAG: CYTH domain-containing protein [Flavobacteriales bacterium]|jgi:adenylate cyclase|nr:CYTH domain-containing protein [Flavobacteriales bacterium]
MNTEIERKFLVSAGTYRQLARESMCIQQAYLNKDAERTVRIRIANQQAWITVKGKSDASGLVRLEWEKEIAVEEAQSLLSLCLPKPILKTRFLVPYHDLEIVVDEFEKPKKMILAEVELPSEDTPFNPPEWLGKEVTGDPSYYNSKI